MIDNQSSAPEIFTSLLPVTKQIQANWTSDWHYDVLVALCLLCKDNLTQVCALCDGTFCETVGNLCSKTMITLKNDSTLTQPEGSAQL